MPLIVANISKPLLLDSMFKDSGNEDFLIKLYTAVSPAVSATSSAGDFTEANFSGYAPITLTRSSWGASVLTSDTAKSTYPMQAWTCGVTVNTIVGYYIVGADSGLLYWAQVFSVPRTLVAGDAVNLTPTFSLESIFGN